MALFEPHQLHSSQGHRLTRSLFRESCRQGDVPIMSIGRHPQPDLVHLPPIFLELTVDDPSEFTFAEYVFGSYAHWQQIVESTWMQPFIEEWRMEADVKRKSNAFKQIYKEATNPAGKSSYSAAKYLIEEPWVDKREKRNKERNKKSTLAASKEIRADVARLQDFMVKEG